MEPSRVSGPDPSQAADVDEFVELFGRLRVWAGAPSYRALARRAGPLLRPPRELSHSTLAGVFRPGRRRLDLDLVVAAVRALGLDEVGVDRWRQACVRVQAEARGGGPTGVFRQLPADLATFTGREAELAAMLEPAAAGSQTVVISAVNGTAGVGKTQLAVHAAHELVRSGRFADAQLYVNLRGFDPEVPPTDPAAVLEGFLRALNVPARHIPAALDERAAMFRDRLQDKQAIIVLDNAADDRHVRDLIPAAPSCLVLITSRRSLAGIDGARLVDLDVFDAEESLALFTSVIGPDRVAAEKEAAEQLIAATGGLPLAVALVASRLRARPAWSLAEAAHALHSRGLDGVQLGARSLRPLIDLSFQGLSAPAKAVARAIGVHPGADYTVPALAAACGIEPAQVETAMEELVFESLVRERVSGRFEVHDLIRAYCADAVAEGKGSDVDRALMLNRLTSWFLRSAHNAAVAIRTNNLPDVADSDVEPLQFDSYDSALSWLDAERANLSAIHSAAIAQGSYDAICQLPIILNHFSTLRFAHAESMAAHRAAVQAARDRRDEAVMTRHLLCLSSRFIALRRMDEAHETLLEALDRSRRGDDGTGEVWALIDLGLLHDASGRYHEAISVWEQAQVISDRLGDRRRAMICCTNIGMTRFRLGQLTESLAMFRLALTDARELGQLRAQALIMGNIGEANLLLHAPEAAHAVYTEQHQLAESVGDRVEIAISLLGIGNALRDLGRLDEAIGYWQEAVAVNRELGSPKADEIEQLIADTEAAAKAEPEPTRDSRA